MRSPVSRRKYFVMNDAKTESYLKDTLEDRATVFQPADGEVLRIGGSTITLKVTSAHSNDQLGIYSIALEPKTIGAQLHYHRYMDETFIVNRGMLTVRHGSHEVEAEAGTIIYVPRFVPHAFANNSSERTELTLIFNPAQRREGFFYGLAEILNQDPVDAAKYLTLYNKYDSYPVDPQKMLPIRNQ